MIHVDDQIEWYQKVAVKGDTAVAFFHIPIQEYHQARVLVGSRGEGPCTPAHNSGFFDAINQKGDVKGSAPTTTTVTKLLHSTNCLFHLFF